MAKTDKNALLVRRRELFACIVAAVVVAIGAGLLSGIRDDYRNHYGNVDLLNATSLNWGIGIAAVVFGGMIFGVAINRMSRQLAKAAVKRRK